MKKALVIFGLSAALPVLADFVKPEIVPAPVSLDYDAKTAVSLNAETKVFIACPEGVAVEWVADRYANWFGAKAIVTSAADLAKPAGKRFGSYRLVTKPGVVEMSAESLRGIQYAMRSLRQAAMPKRGGLKVHGWMAPAMTIDDEPALDFRGIHIIWMPELTLGEIEKKIRLAAAYKLRYVVLEPWGVYKSTALPWYAGVGTMDESAARHLARVAADEGIDIIPQLNVFGHASGARSRSGKHVVLDVNADYQTLFEPRGGWNWCLSNPETLKVQETLIAELLDWFGNHGYFHIGCDEADKPSCPDCNDGNYAARFIGHVTKLRDFLKAKNVQAIMWHDKLLDKDDQRFDYWCARGDAAVQKLLETQLPKDVIIDYWAYGDGVPVEGFYPHVEYFTQIGFPVLMSPWEGKNGIAGQGEYAVKRGLLGMLGTTWHRTAGWPMADIFAETACAAWGTPVPGAAWYERVLFAQHWRHVIWDMGITDPKDTGFAEDQVSRSMNGD